MPAEIAYDRHRRAFVMWMQSNEPPVSISRTPLRLSLPLGKRGYLFACRDRPARGNFVAGQLIPRTRSDGRNVDRRFRGDDDGAHLFAALRVVDPDDNALCDLGEFLDHRFDLERGYVGARGFNEFTGPSDIEQARVVFPAVDAVPGVVPAVGVKGLAALALVVADHCPNAADQELAGGPCWGPVRRVRPRWRCR